MVSACCVSIVHSGKVKSNPRRLKMQCVKLTCIRGLLLFSTASGKPLSQRNVLRSLHTITPVGLAFRRYRTDVLRRAGCPEDLIKLWLGHAGASVTDAYARGLRGDINWRRQWCERVGLGFESKACLGDIGDKT